MNRKGFTLVELLIVVAILGALAAIMTVSSGSSIAKAKATAIANNLRICSTGAQLYYLESGDSETAEIGTIGAKQVLTATVPNFADFSSATDKIKFDSKDKENTTSPKKWQVTVTLSGADSPDIVKSLKTIKGFTKLTKTNPITYNLFEGTIEN